MNKVLVILCLIIMSGVNSFPQQGDFPKLTGPYLGQIPPKKVPEVFAPGIISVDSNFEHSAAVFSPDGDEVFWCTSIDWYLDKPRRNKIRLYYMKVIDGIWSAPQAAPFVKNINLTVQRPVFSPDGNELYFEHASDPGNDDSDSDIFVVKRTGDGWSEPAPVSQLINSPAIERLHCVTADGSLYFSRNPMQSDEGIYVSKLINGEFTKPEKLGKSYDSDDPELAIVIGPNEEYMLIDQKDNRYTSHLYISYKKGDGSWSDRIRTPYICSGIMALSPDSKYLFFLNGGIFWVNTSFVDDLRPSDLK